MQFYSESVYRMAQSAEKTTELNTIVVNGITEFAVIPYITLSIFCALLNVINSITDKTKIGLFLRLCAIYAGINCAFIISMHCFLVVSYYLTHNANYLSVIIFHIVLIFIVCILIYILLAIIKQLKRKLVDKLAAGKVS